MLKQGDKGKEVIKLQESLLKLGREVLKRTPADMSCQSLALMVTSGKRLFHRSPPLSGNWSIWQKRRAYQ